MEQISYYFLLLYVFSLPNGNLLKLPAIGELGKYFLFASAGLYLISRLKSSRKISFFQKNDQQQRVFNFLLFLFLIWASLSFFWTASEFYTLASLKILLTGVLAIILIFGLAKTERKTTGLFAAYILGSLVSVIGIFIAFYHNQFYMMNFRFSAYGLDPNDLAVMLSLAVPMSLYAAIKQNNLVKKILYILFIPLVIPAILLTASRGGFLAFIPSLLIIPWLFLKIPKKLKIIIIMFIIIGSYGILLFVPDQTFNRIIKLPQNLEAGDFNIRQQIWAASVPIIESHPVIGVGAGAFRVVVAKQLGEERVTHNTLLSILAEEGIIGLLIFSAILVLLILSIIKLPDLERKVWTIILSTWFVGTASLTWDFRLHTWLIIGMLANCIFLNKKAVHDF